jgi:hypothetical protein
MKLLIMQSSPAISYSYVQIFPSAPCSQTSLVYVLPLARKTKFHTYTKQVKILILYILILSFYRGVREILK